jgi:hypothetical protein
MGAHLEVWLQEGPASADEHDDGEEQDALEEAEHVEGDVPPVRRAGALHVPLVLGGARQLERLEQQQRAHHGVDALRGLAVLDADVQPRSQEHEVHDGRGREDARQRQQADGQVLLGAGAADVEHLGAHLHGDLDAVLAAAEKHRVLVVGVDGQGALPGAVGRDLLEPEERLHVLAGERAEGGASGLGVVGLVVDQVDEGVGDEEEAHEGRVRGLDLGPLGDLPPDAGGGDGGAAAAPEAELLEQDHGARVGDNGRRLDLCASGGQHRGEGSSDGEDDRGGGHGGSIELHWSREFLVRGGHGTRPWPWVGECRCRLRLA